MSDSLVAFASNKLRQAFYYHRIIPYVSFLEAFVDIKRIRLGVEKTV